MAKISGNLVSTEVSTDSGTTWKTLICETTSGANMTREQGTTAPRTKCDAASTGNTFTPAGYTWDLPFTAMVDTEPTATQLTYADMLTLFIAATQVLVRRQYDSSGTEFYTSGSAYLTSLSETSAVDDYVTFNGTFTGVGDLDIVA